MKPNDGHCHLSAAGVYTEAENQVKILFLTPNKRREKNRVATVREKYLENEIFSM